MFTKRQSKLLDQLFDRGAQDSDAPHLSELSGALTRAFGGVDALAEMLATLANDPTKPDWLRTRAYGLAVNSIAAASKLSEREPEDDLGLLSTEDLKRAAIHLFREMLGIDETMDGDLAAVVAAWYELPAATRASIVDAVKTAQADPSNTPSTGD